MTQPILFAVIDMNVLFADKIYVPSLLRDELVKLSETGWPEGANTTPERVYDQFQEMALGVEYVRMAKEGQWIALVIGDTDALLASKRCDLFVHQRFGDSSWNLVGSKVADKESDDSGTERRSYQGGYQHRMFDQFGGNMEQPNPWGHVSNDMLVELLNHFSMTQILPFPPVQFPIQIPSGLELVQLIQSRLTGDYRTFGTGRFNHVDPRFTGGIRPQPPIYGNGNAFYSGMNAPQASNGRYARHGFTGAWVWYPATPVFVVLNVDRTDDKPQTTLDKLLYKILENMGMYGLVGEQHIPNMVKEIKATLENHPRSMSLLLNDQVTLFVGDQSQVHPALRDQTDNYYTNWLLADGAWNPQEEYKPINVIQCIEGVAKYIPGYMDDRFGGRPVW